MDRKEYLKLRESSLIAPNLKIEISDEDLLRKIAEYVEQAYYVFEKNYQEPPIVNRVKLKETKNKSEAKKVYKNNLFVDEILSNDNSYEANELFKFIVDLRGFNGLPTVVSDDEFEKQQTNTDVLYRGSINKNYISNLLADKNKYHYGWGVRANGIYSSTSKQFARGYAIYDDENILKFLVKGKGVYINTLEYALMFIDLNIKDELIEMFKVEDENIQKRVLIFYEAYQKLPETIKKYVNYAIKFDLSLLGLFLGYDYVTKNANDENQEVCVLNRASMVVPQSEYDRFVKGTEYETETGKTFEQA